MVKERTERALCALKERDIDQMLIVDPLSIGYLSGVFLDPGERFYALLLRSDGRNVLFVNRLFAVPEDPDYTAVNYDDTDPVMDIVSQYIDAAGTLGVDKDLRARFLLPLMENFPALVPVNASEAIDVTRAVKDESEEDRMRVSSGINDQAMDRFRALVRAGVTEKEIADQTLAIYRELGAQDYSFPPIVSFGANAADPHHMPDNTILQEGDCVLFDVGCVKDRYCSDMTRTFYYRTVGEEERRIYETVRRANEKAEEIIRPGVKLCAIDAAARNLIAEAGYGPYFTHRLGHFIGLADHEYGDVSSANAWEAVPGMIFSIEPGIYLPGNTGVRIEDLVLVTEDGCEVLNHYSKELQIIR